MNVRFARRVETDPERDGLNQDAPLAEEERNGIGFEHRKYARWITNAGRISQTCRVVVNQYLNRNRQIRSRIVGEPYRTCIHV